MNRRSFMGFIPPAVFGAFGSLIGKNFKKNLKSKRSTIVGEML